MKTMRSGFSRATLSATRARGHAAGSLQSWTVLPLSRHPVSPNTAIEPVCLGSDAGIVREPTTACDAPAGMMALHDRSAAKALSVVTGAFRSRIFVRFSAPLACVVTSTGQSMPFGTIARATRPDGVAPTGAVRL